MIEPTERQARALALRRAGKKWREIAREIGTSEGSARQHVQVALLKEQRAAEKQQPSF